MLTVSTKFVQKFCFEKEQFSYFVIDIFYKIMIMKGLKITK